MTARGGKPTALLGRDFLCAVWPQLAAALSAEADLAEFARAFKTELRAAESLFWAPSFDAALLQRREARAERVSQRVADLVQACTAPGVTELP